MVYLFSSISCNLLLHEFKYRMKRRLSDSKNHVLGPQMYVSTKEHIPFPKLLTPRKYMISQTLQGLYSVYGYFVSIANYKSIDSS